MTPQEMFKFTQELKHHILGACMQRLQHGDYVYFDPGTDALILVSNITENGETRSEVTELGFELNGQPKRLSDLPARLQFEIGMMVNQLHTSALQNWYEMKAKEEARAAQSGIIMPGQMAGQILRGGR